MVIDPLYLITARRIVEVRIDLLHAHPEQALLHWISISRLFTVVFAELGTQERSLVNIITRV